MKNTLYTLISTLFFAAIITTGCGSAASAQQATTPTPTPPGCNISFEQDTSLATPDPYAGTFYVDPNWERVDTNPLPSVKFADDDGYGMPTPGDLTLIDATIDRDVTYASHNTYHIQGTLEYKTTTNDLTYSIVVTGGTLGDKSFTCSQ